MGSIVPIGLHPFPRPAEQWAWVIEMRLGQEFQTTPIVSKIRFRHDQSVSEYFFELFANGKVLFPPDAMSFVANIIKASKVAPQSIIAAALSKLAEDPFGYNDLLPGAF